MCQLKERSTHPVCGWLALSGSPLSSDQGWRWKENILLNKVKFVFFCQDHYRNLQKQRGLFTWLSWPLKASQQLESKIWKVKRSRFKAGNTGLFDRCSEGALIYQKKKNHWLQEFYQAFSWIFWVKIHVKSVFLTCCGGSTAGGSIGGGGSGARGST